MTAERWKRLSQLYHATLAREPAARAAFLDTACVEDPELRADVESLLQHEHDLPSVPALDVIAAEIGTRSPSAAIGARLGAYEIQSLIGEGGMGQVYRAHDAELGRDVAIKVLPPVFALDPNRCARFEREARVLASLNHPHIAAIYGIAEGDGFRGLVLELVEGETLADRLRAMASGSRSTGGLPVREALVVASQIAEALDAAHEKGVIHRDLKPANIKMTPGGDVKVLDFGLAKATSRQDDVTEVASTAGTEVRDTGVGVLLGTAAYMSPEQALGKPVDKRTDIWAFGCVLYEMLTGQPGFGRDTAPSTIAAVIEHEPHWSAVPSVTPPGVVRLLRRCLEKDPKRRLRDIGEALICLEEALNAPPQSMSVASVDRVPRPGLWMATAVATAAVVGGAVAWNPKPRASPASAPIIRLAVPVTLGQQPAALRRLALSADGKYLAYVSDQAGGLRLCVRALNSSETRVLPGTEGASAPFFSPDSQWVAFFAAGSLNKIPVAGGAVVTVFDLPSVQAAVSAVWGPSDTIFLTTPTGIWRVSAAGSAREPVTVVERSKEEIAHRSPLLLPGGKTLLYTVWYGPGWDERRIVAQRLGSEDKQVLVSGADNARYATTGHLIYTRAGELMAVRFDASRLEVSGAPVTLLNDLREGTPAADFDVSHGGTLAYVEQSREAYNRLPVLVDRTGVAQRLPGLPGAYLSGSDLFPRRFTIGADDHRIDHRHRRVRPQTSEPRSIHNGGKQPVPRVDSGWRTNCVSRNAFRLEKPVLEKPGRDNGGRAAHKR